MRRYKNKIITRWWGREEKDALGEEREGRKKRLIRRRIPRKSVK